LGPRYDVVQAEFSRRGPLAAILAGVSVTGEDVAPVEFYLLPGELGERQNADDPWNNQVKADGANPIMPSGLELLLEGTELSPVLEIVREVPTVLDVNDLRNRPLGSIPFEQECERPTYTHHPQRRIVRVEQQNVAIKAGRRTSHDVSCEDATSTTSRTGNR